MSLVIANNFDFESNKVAPRIDPNNPTRVTTSMLTFSEPIWEPRARLYATGISKMKEKDWNNIMKAIANNTTTTNLKKKGRAPVTEEEAELSWESETE